MTAGENRFARRLQDKLDDDTVCWFNIPIHGYYPDFVLFHPQRGLLVLEVKDWKIDNIEIFSRLHVALRNVPEVLKENPLEQAKRSRREIVKQLGSGFLAQHRIAYGEGVVLTNITRKMYCEARFDEVLPGNLVICSDEMYESVPPEQFSAQLWGMLPFQMQTTLNDALIQRIRGTLYPEICIPLKQAELFSHEIVEAQVPESMGILKVMDLQQEQLARSLGVGHRIIHGVAGSGKTVILKYRAEYLAKSATQPILVVCYNKSLAQDLTLYFEHKNLSDKVHVYSFHAWCSAQLKAHGCQKPPKENNIDLYCQSLVTTVLNHLENKSLPRQQYAAVLIDEGMTLKPIGIKSWCRCSITLKHCSFCMMMPNPSMGWIRRRSKRSRVWASMPEGAPRSYAPITAILVPCWILPSAFQTITLPMKAMRMPCHC
ncbi:hypothetical protein BMY_0554 [Wohlfahrtiimonas chitiniclastica]|nr:hypothetical protein BMY_0554 [Wohlfahrtiimonas chitiniclastica]